YALYDASNDVIGGRLSVGDIAIFGATALSLRNAVDGLINSVGDFRWHTLHIRELRRFLSLPGRVHTATASASVDGRGRLVVDAVCFTYPDTERQILREVSFEVEPGETVAIVGENGSGKSTLVKLVAGLYVPDQGRVLLDGVDVGTLDSEALANQISFVFQS